MVEKAAFYVDGFNLYHPINSLGEPHLKWLDLWKVGKLLIPSKSQKLVKVVYCTAYKKDDAEKTGRHKKYVAALEAQGVDCVFGHYIKAPESCRACSSQWEVSREKQTDINLALHLIVDGFAEIYDHAYLLSADSDQAATAKMFAQKFQSKKLTTVTPPGRNFSSSILQHTTLKLALNQNHLERCLLPATIFNDNASRVITRRPDEYATPSGWVPPDKGKS